MYVRQDKKWREVDALKDLRDERIVQYIDSWIEEVSTEWWSHEAKKYVCLCNYVATYMNYFAIYRH